MIYNYNEATKKNLGWISKTEQEKIKNTKVAIAGLGGVGGDHLETFARLGITKFHIADLDTYDLGNFNRQSGARISTVGKTKLETAENTLKQINPEIQVKSFSQGVTTENIDEFLEGVDIYIDCLDIFVLEMRREVFKKCAIKKIPALSAAPLGFGASLLYFHENAMTFEEYFNLKDYDPEHINKLKNNKHINELYKYKFDIFFENIVSFLAGVGPKAYQRHYLVSGEKVDLFKKDLPSVKMGMNFAAGLMGTALFKVIAQRGQLKPVPHVQHFDAYLGKYSNSFTPVPKLNPMRVLTKALIKKKINLNERKIELFKTIDELYKQGKLGTEVNHNDLINVLFPAKN